MRRLCLLAAVIMLLCPVLCLSGCKSKPALTADEFRDSLLSLGYVVNDTTADCSDPDRTVQVYTASRSDGAYQIVFTRYDYADTAQMIFLGTQLAYESESHVSRSRVSSNIGNYNYYALTVGGRFRVLLRVNEIMITADADEEYKAEIKDVLKALGY